MKRFFSLILSLLIGVNCCLLPALPVSVSAEEPESYIPEPISLMTRSDFGFGIITHPKNYAAYPEIYLEQQIHAVARAGCKWIRFGGGIPDDGDWTYLDTAVGLCNKYGLKIIMVLQPAISFGLDYITLSCQTMAYRYNGKDGRGFVDCFQIWNEVDSELMRDKYGGSAPDGVSEDCYFTIPVDGAKDLPEYLEYYTAAEKGIHSKDCSSKFMVNFASTHCGMVTYFLKHGLKIDLVGWDLYATRKDREDSAQNFCSIYDTVEEKLYDPYKVPVILCEINVDMRTLSTTERNESKLESYDR
ncbi:MAG: hypothetical protein J5766_04615, partial [Clostridia bacterium]|nr:hypothetical protein [Clostridia bacterium]